MNRKLQFAIVAVVMFTASVLRAGEIIDRVVATVGKRPILQSELDEALRYEMFAAGRQLTSATDADVKLALQRMVDQTLIHEDVGPAEAFAPTEEDVRKRVAELRAQIVASTDDEAWSSLLKQYGLTTDIVTGRIRSQLETMRIVNSRLRPGVRIDQSEVETAYRQEFLPKLRQAGAKELSLPEASPKIRQILVERRISEALEKWLEALRTQTDTHVLVRELRRTENTQTSTDGVAQPGSK